MSGAPTPPVLLEPIASAADPAFITNPMPDAPTGTNAASVKGGFPPVTMQPEAGGGQPPLGQDMNGFMFLVSSHTMAMQCGQPYLYNATLAAAIGGYLAGTILGMADGTGQWLNTVNGNTSNPDAGGAGWVPLSSYGLTTITTAGGTTNLTAAQARYSVIVVNGALTSNALLVFPNRVGKWLVVNSTTGAFNVTVSAGGSGVAVPPGGPGSPTGVYCIGDTNLYPSVSPLAVPIDQAPNPLTLVERTNNGYVLATYFNQNSPAEDPAIANIFVDAGDGYLRKISKLNFLAQLGPVGSITNPGWCRLQNGLLLQWGPISAPGWASNPIDVHVDFPVAFATGVFFASAVGNRSVAGNGQALNGSNFTSNYTLTGMTATIDSNIGRWFAIGL